VDTDGWVGLAAFKNIYIYLLLQSWPRPTKWTWRCYLRRGAAPPSCAAWCPRSSRNWYEWSRGFMNPLSTSIPRCKAVSYPGRPSVVLLPTARNRKETKRTKRSGAQLSSAPLSLHLHPCPCGRKANKVHCLFAVFASHVCLLNCHFHPHLHHSPLVLWCIINIVL